MTLETAGAIVLIVGAFGGLWFGVVKFGPERNKIIVETAEVSVRMARDDRAALALEIQQLRDEFHAYKTDTQNRLAELNAELRSERAMKEHVKQENQRLVLRVIDLEAQVAQLRGGAS